MTVKYPKIKVKLTGRDSNAFVMIGAVSVALRRGGVPNAEIDTFRKEATSGDYNKVLATIMEWVRVS